MKLLALLTQFYDNDREAMKKDNNGHEKNSSNYRCVTWYRTCNRCCFCKAGYNLVITCSKSETELLHLKNDLERDYSVDVLASIGDISDFEYVTQLFFTY